MKPVRMAPLAAACLLVVVACNKHEDKSDTTTTTSGERATSTPSTANDNRDHNRYGDRDRARSSSSDREHVGTTTTTGAHVGSVSYETATSRIVAARCDREAACNNIGAKKRFVDRTVCTHELGAKLADDLKPSECPNGVDAKHLDDCLDAINKEACGNIIDTISRAGACQTSGLCLKADEKPSR